VAPAARRVGIEAQPAGTGSVASAGAVFAALESALDADLARESERYRLRETIAAVLRPWFATRDVKQVSDDLDAARVLWGRYQGMNEVVAAHRTGRHAVLADVEIPGDEALISGRSPMRWNGEHGSAGSPSRLGADTAAVLAEALGLTGTEISRLADRRVIATG
jgi:2-methylfumaryl-CoA isomerase